MNDQRPAIKQKILDPMIIRKMVTFAVATGFLFLGACASTPKTPPPPGSAIIDVKPDPDRRRGVDGIALVSINGGKAKGTRSVIKPGLNTIKIQFNWPHGQDQQADLQFYATQGTVYTIHYEVYPTRTKFKSSVAEKMIDGSGLDIVLVGPLAAITGVGERIAHNVHQNRLSSTYIDLVVLGSLSEGMARKIRVFPDGRVQTKPWSSWAQMQAPEKRQ
jgi:hypothetical protein